MPMPSLRIRRLDKLRLGLTQGSDFRVSLIVLMFYMTVCQNAWKSNRIGGSEDSGVFSDWVYLIIIRSVMTLAENEESFEPPGLLQCQEEI